MAYERTDSFSCGHKYKVGKHGKKIQIRVCPTCDKGQYESSIVKTDEKQRPLQPVTEDRERITIRPNPDGTFGTSILDNWEWHTTGSTTNNGTSLAAIIYGQPIYTSAGVVSPPTPIAEGADLPPAPTLSYSDLRTMYNTIAYSGSYHEDESRQTIRQAVHNALDEQHNTSPAPTFDQQRAGTRRLHTAGLLTDEEYHEDMDAIGEAEYDEGFRDAEDYGQDGEVHNS